MTPRKPREWVYEVRGEGNFPIDMLRYEGARPCRREDSETIRHTFLAEPRLRTVRLVSDYHGPNEPMWRGHDWPVVALGLPTLQELTRLSPRP